MISLPLFIVLLLVILAVGIHYIVYYYYKIKKYLEVKREMDKLPGPSNLPLLGNMHLLMGTPEESFKKIRTLVKNYGPFLRFWIGTFPAVVVTSPEDVEIMISTMKNHRKAFIYNMIHCWLGTGLLTSQGDKWRMRRKILTPSFHFSILREFMKVFNEHADQLVTAIKEDSSNGEINIVNFIAQFTLNTICETSMGISLKEDDKGLQSKYMRNVSKLGELLHYRMTNPWFISDPLFAFTRNFQKMRKICQTLHCFSSSVIKEREESYKGAKDKENLAHLVDGKGHPDEDMGVSEEDEWDNKKKRLAMLDVLLSAKYNSGAIDDEGIREEVDTFIFGGHDTIAMSLSFTCMLLACNRDCQDKVYEEIMTVLGEKLESPLSTADLNELRYMEQCIKESLRLYPSVPIIGRLSDGVTTSEGYWIPRGCTIAVLIYDMHRNPALYPDPERFLPERFLPEQIAKRHPFAYIPFSAGPRNCIGQKFAMMEMKTALVSILKNFILEPIDTPETIVLVSDLVLRSKNGVKVKFTPRHY